MTRGRVKGRGPVLSGGATIEVGTRRTARLGGAAGNLETFTTTRWVTLRSRLPDYPS